MAESDPHRGIFDMLSLERAQRNGEPGPVAKLLAALWSSEAPKCIVALAVNKLLFDIHVVRRVDRFSSRNKAWVEGEMVFEGRGKD